MFKTQGLLLLGLMTVLLIVLSGAIVMNRIRYGGDPAKAYSAGKAVHWHAVITATVCGEEQRMPIGSPGNHEALGPIHTHDDGIAHMEAVFNRPQDVAVKKYLTAMKIPYSEKGIFMKIDGSPCESEAASGGRLRGIVNGKEVSDILNQPMHNPADPDTQQDHIHLIYE